MISSIDTYKAFVKFNILSKVRENTFLANYIEEGTYLI